MLPIVITVSRFRGDSIPFFGGENPELHGFTQRALQEPDGTGFVGTTEKQAKATALPDIENRDKGGDRGDHGRRDRTSKETLP